MAYTENAAVAASHAAWLLRCRCCSLDAAAGAAQAWAGRPGAAARPAAAAAADHHDADALVPGEWRASVCVCERLMAGWLAGWLKQLACSCAK